MILNDPMVKTFWWPRFEKIAHWFIETERARRPNIAASKLNVRGNGRLIYQMAKLPEQTFTLTAKADRIDILQGWEGRYY